MNVILPDGTELRDVPDGTTRAQIVAKLKANGYPVPAEWLDKTKAEPAAVTVGSALRDIPRQAGLVARTAVHAGTALPAMLTDAATGVYNAGADVAGIGGPRFQRVRQSLDAAMTAIGLPEPRGANERVITDAGEIALGTGLLSRGADVLSKGAQGATRHVLERLSSMPVQQGVGAATAGLAGGAVREAGGGPVEQFVASLAGGLAGGIGAQGALRAYDALAAKMTPVQMVNQRADQAITLILERAGIDWNAVPNSIKSSLRTEVADALNTGRPLNEAAIRRLVVFRKVGVTPTVGMLTQNPATLTAEKNLAKVGANATDRGLQRLPELENANVQRLLTALDDAGAGNAPSQYQAGQAAVKDLRSTVASARARNDAMYRAARDSSGRWAELDGPKAAQAAIAELKDKGVGKLPPEVDEWLNDLVTGKTPLTVDYQQKLVRNLYRKMQGTADGDVRTGLRIIREALDAADPLPAPQVNPRNLPAVPRTVPPSPMPQAENAIEAYTRARAGHRSLMTRLERSPALAAADDGLDPDQVVQRFVIGQQSSARETAAMLKDLRPETRDAVRQSVAAYLRDKATNGSQDLARFNGQTYRNALRQIGDVKLNLLFGKEGAQRLRDIGQVSQYMQAQPAGSAVNNSNTGALMLGRGLDWLDTVAGKIPFGFRDVIRGQVQGMQQSAALNPRNALTLLADRQGVPALPVNPLLMLAVQPRQDQ